MLIPSSEVLALVSFVNAVKPPAQFISGVLALLVLFISALMQVFSFGLGVEIIGPMFLAGLVLIAFDLAIQGLVNWFTGIGSLSFDSAIRDLVILGIGAFVGISIRNNILNYLVGLAILGFTIVVWGLPGVIQRFAG
jgi:hypothetical protein